MKSFRFSSFILCFCFLLLLAACGTEATPTEARSTRGPTFAPVPTAEPTQLFPSPTPLTVPPTFTPFRPPSTPTNTPYVLPTFTPTPAVSSLDRIARAKASFRNVYNQAIGRIQEIDPSSGLVLAQTSLIGPTRAVWMLYFVKPKDDKQPDDKMWVVTFDTDQAKPGVDSNRKPILVNDAGQIDVAKVLDTFVLVDRVAAKGFPPTTPVDTLILQMYQTKDKKRIPAWYLVNSTFNRQLVVNAYTGDIMENSFNQ